MVCKNKDGLIGIDGSGKSTHLATLFHELHDNDLCCKYVNLRGEHFRFISLPFLLLCKLVRREGRFVTKGREYRTRHPDFGGPKNRINLVWSFLFLIDISILALWRGYFSPRPEVILCDRCILDSIVDLMASLGDNTLFRKSVVRLFLSVMRPDIVILLDVEEKKALNRGREILGLDYLEVRRVLYQKVASNLEIPIVDSGKPFESVHKTIIDHINSLHCTLKN